MVNTEMATKKATKAAKAMKEEGKQIGVRLSAEDYARLERLATRLSPGTLARVALMLGLDVIEANPGVLLGEPPKKR